MDIVALRFIHFSQRAQHLLQYLDEGTLKYLFYCPLPPVLLTCSFCRRLLLRTRRLVFENMTPFNLPVRETIGSMLKTLFVGFWKLPLAQREPYFNFQTMQERTRLVT